MPKKKLFVLRHGQSIWNRQKRWAGWSDIPLSARGKQETKQAAQILIKKINMPQNFTNKIIDEIYTSDLKRTKQTADIFLKEFISSKIDIPITSSWRLNEKHYGVLQGMLKKQAIQQYGQEKVNIWRRSFDQPPPPIEIDDQRHPIKLLEDSRIDPELLPGSECLKDVVSRVEPLWQKQLKPKILQDKRILLVAHGSSIRALNLLSSQKKSVQQISKMQLPNAIPMIYYFDDEARLQSIEYLGNIKQIMNKINSLKQQTNL